MRFSNFVIAALSAPFCVDGTSKDDATEETDVASFRGMHSGDEEKNRLSRDDELMALRSFRNEKAGLVPIDLDAWTQATELRNPENVIDHASRDENENDDDFAVDIGVLSTKSQPSTECALHPVVNETGELSAWAFSYLVSSCYSGSPYLEYCPYEYSVGLHCWNTSFITDLSHAFEYFTAFNDDISSWDIGKVTDMSFTFRQANSFNSDISSWDTGSVTALYATFAFASSFNSDLSSWDTGNVTSLFGTFFGASSFNSDISSWDTREVTDMMLTFYGASSFNVDISSWDTREVTDIMLTFYGASSFNVDISSWDTGKVTDMGGAFAGASSFNVDISSWDIRNVVFTDYMFYGATEFNQCLGGWAAKTPDTVTTSSMLKNTACPKQSDPNPRKGPWCQGFEDRCFGACRDAKQFRFGKNDQKSCNAIKDITAPTEKKLKKKIRRFCNRKAFRHEEEMSGKTIRVKDVCQKACGSRGFGPGKRC